VQGAATTSLRLLRGALDDLLGLCELGARLRDPAATARIAAIAARFDAIGLHPLARPLAEAARAKNDERAKAILVAVHALETLRRMPRGLVC